MNIVESIEKCDLSAENLHLREQTCKTIIAGLSEITQENRICAAVKEAYQIINLAEQRHGEIRWWMDAFLTYKGLWTSIKEKT